MKDHQEFEQDLASIRNLMERSVKFISLSGMSGILSGIYALVGAGAAYYFVQYPDSILEYQAVPAMDPNGVVQLFVIAVVVLTASIGTGLWMSARKARRMGINVWDNTVRRLILNLAIPLVAGGLFVIISVWNGNYGIVSSACLIFYGLALINASPNLYDEVRYLGYSEIVLGLIAAAWPGYGLIFWSIGFGLLHIVYGTALYRKYDS